MTDQRPPTIAQRVAAAHTQRVAGRNFEGNPRGAARQVWKLVDALKNLDGLIYYRLHGEGARDALSGEPFLDDKQKREVKEYQKEYEAAVKKLKEAEKALDELAVKGKSLDTYMSFM